MLVALPTLDPRHHNLSLKDLEFAWGASPLTRVQRRRMADLDPSTMEQYSVTHRSRETLPGLHH